jgi:quercetin dioxygenase-like cupin family protein
MFFLTSCQFDKNEQTMETQSNESVFPQGEKITNGHFTGEAYLKPLITKDTNNDFVIGNVTFQPRARTNWHTHPKGQVLLVIEGEGLYQEKGKPAQVIKKGDVINIPANKAHWHGASAQNKMTHIAITNYKGEENVVWLQAVSDVEYKEANKH